MKHRTHRLNFVVIVGGLLAALPLHVGSTTQAGPKQQVHPGVAIARIMIGLCPEKKRFRIFELLKSERALSAERIGSNIRGQSPDQLQATHNNGERPEILLPVNFVRRLEKDPVTAWTQLHNLVYEAKTAFSKGDIDRIIEAARSHIPGSKYERVSVLLNSMVEVLSPTPHNPDTDALAAKQHVGPRGGAFRRGGIKSGRKQFRRSWWRRFPADIAQ